MEQGPKPTRRRWRALKVVELTLSVILIILLAAYVFQFRLRGGGDAETPSVRLEDVVVDEVRVGPFQDYLPVEGTVQPLNTVYMDAVEGGRVEKIFVEVGSLVKEGDPILELTNSNLLMDIMYREAELFQQSNNLRNTRLSMEQYKLQLNQQLSEVENQVQQQKKLYDRYKELDKDSLISKQEFESARDQYEYLLRRKDLMERSQKSELAMRNGQLEALEDSLKRMEGNLQAVKQKQDNLTIKAPVPGQVTSLNAELGQTKTPGQRLGQIDSFNGFKASAFIDERYIGRIDVDKTGSFDIDNHPFKIVVKKVYPEVKDNKFEVELEFRGERPKAIKRGQTLHISLDLGEISKVVILPRGEFLAVTEGQWIYRVDLAAREAVRTAIKLGRQNAVACEVLRGLKLGDRVITSSYASFGGKDKLVLKER